MRRLAFLAVAFFLAANSAQAAPRTLAEVPASAPVGAFGGWVAWSVPASAAKRSWSLRTFHDGAIVAPPVQPREAAFDLDLGSDFKGRPVATYSRCTKTVSPPEEYLSTGHRGCRVYVLDLASGRERAAGIPRPKGASDTMPSMWRGRIAFARTPPHSRIDQVMLWRPARKRLRKLKHGGLPGKCVGFDADVGFYPNGTPCGRSPGNIGQVSALDLGARLVAFRWNVSSAAVVGHAASELRASTLDGRRSTLLQGGYVYESCDDGDSVTSFSRGRPTVDGGAVSFSTEAKRCEGARFELNRARTRPYRVSKAPIPGNTLKFGITQVVQSGRRLYGLIGRQITEDRDAACPCALKSLDVPKLKRSGAERIRPFEF